MPKLPQAATENLVVQNSGKELLIYDLGSNKAVCLNQTAALVWKYCDGKTDIGAIAGNVGRALGKTVDRDLIVFALDQLEAEGLLLPNSETFKNGFEGLSRREIVKKIGFGSMVALPIVSSIAAPNAANAQSCGLGQPGTPGTNMTTCVGTVGDCTDLCTMDAFFLAGCCSGMGVLNPPAGPCDIMSPCTCLCA